MRTKYDMLRLLAAGALLAACSLLGGCGAPPPMTPEQVTEAEAERGGYELITGEELAELYDAGQEMLLVDTRQDWEFRQGYIEGAVHFSMEPTFLARQIQRAPLARLLGEDRDKLLVFY